MEQNIFNYDKIYSNNNNILLEIVNNLQQLMNYSKDDLIIKTLGNIIIKMNCIINENNKNLEMIRNDINKIYNHMDKKFDELNFNNKINNQELQRKDGKYIGQVINGKAEGKGICYFINGDRYEGDCKNDKREGKRIYYYNNGDRYEGDYRNGKKEGKGIYYYNNGDRYEGDYRNDKREGKGIYYYNNGERRMGDYYNDKPIGKHAVLTKNGEVKTNYY